MLCKTSNECIDCPSFSLSAEEAGKLVRLLRAKGLTDRNLVKHYANNRDNLYWDFLKSLCSAKTEYYDLEKKKMVAARTYNETLLIKALADQIFGFDTDLEKLFDNEELKRRIGKFTHKEVSELFAKNLIAENPIAPLPDLLS